MELTIWNEPTAVLLDVIVLAVFSTWVGFEEGATSIFPLTTTEPDATDPKLMLSGLVL